jgi:hypothetical protein
MSCGSGAAKTYRALAVRREAFLPVSLALLLLLQVLVLLLLDFFGAAFAVCSGVSMLCLVK